MKDNQAKYPQLRFKGFTDPWEERKLGDAVSISSGVTGDATLQDGKYRLTRIESISQGMLNVARLGFTNEKPDQKYLLNLGDILYSNINSLSHIGKVALVDTAGIYHGINLLRFQMHNDVDSEFLFQRLNTMPMKSWAVSHANPAVSQASINQTELSKQPISSPTITEQQKIGSFFKQLDDTIALHQRKLAKLKELKQGYLQKLFPENGSKFPQLRFSGFADAWEQRKLEDISSVITKGTTPKDKSWRGEVNYVKTESIDSNSGNISVMAKTSLEEHEGYLKRSQLQDGDVLFTIVGTLGRIGVVKNKDLPANTNQQIAIIRLNNANNRFVFHALKTSRIASFIKSDATIGAQPSLSLWQINGLKIPYPSLKEQDKIGGFFEHLDHLITLHQRKLEKLQELKKGYLQKMFC